MLYTYIGYFVHIYMRRAIERQVYLVQHSRVRVYKSARPCHCRLLLLMLHAFAECIRVRGEYNKFNARKCHLCTYYIMGGECRVCSLNGIIVYVKPNKYLISLYTIFFYTTCANNFCMAFFL